MKRTRLPRRHRFKLLILCVLLIFAIGRQAYFFFVTPYTENTLEVHCLDVGQGDSTLIAGPSQMMLIDAAEQEMSDEIAIYLREMGVKKLDFLVATHPHDDHIGGMADLMEQFQIGCLVITAEDSPAYSDLIAAAKQRGIPVKISEPGEEIPYADACCTVLGPLAIDDKNSNNNSMILRIDYESTRFLFTGDAEQEEELALVQAGADLSADFLQVGHHGSDTSSGNSFLAQVSPDCAVISCGTGNQFGHPSPQALERLKRWCAQIFRTDLEGTIVIVSDGQQLYRKMAQ